MSVNYCTNHTGLYALTQGKIPYATVLARADTLRLVRESAAGMIVAE